MLFRVLNSKTTSLIEYIIAYMLYIISGNILNPISIPIIPPNNVAKMAYIIYFDAIFNFVYPNAF